MHKIIFKSTTYQLIARVITSGIGLIVTIVIARYFGVLGYGDFTKVTAFVGLFYLVLDFGLNAVFLQKEKESHFRDLFYTRLLFAFFLIILVNLIAIFLPFNRELNFGFSEKVRLGIFIFSLTLIGQAIIISSTAIFQKRQRFDFLTKANTTGALTTLFLILLFSFFSLPLGYVFLAFVFGGAISGFLSIFWTEQKLLPFSLDLSYITSLVKESLPIGLMFIFNLIYFRVDIFLLSLFKPTADVGIYGLAYKFFDVLIALPLFLSNSLYPFLLKAQKNNKHFVSTTKKYFLAYLLISILLIVPFWFLSPLFSRVGKEFASSVLPFRILLLSLPFFFTTSLLQWVLISKKEQKFLVPVYFFSTLISIVLNLLFIPTFSYVACAVITGVLEAVVFILLAAKFISVRRIFV